MKKRFIPSNEEKKIDKLLISLLRHYPIIDNKSRAAVQQFVRDTLA